MAPTPPVRSVPLQAAPATTAAFDAECRLIRRSAEEVDAGSGARRARVAAERSDAGPDVRVARLAAEQWGVLALGELLACGLSPDAITVRVRRGRLHRRHRGVYAVGHPNVPLNGRFLAAVKACGPGAVLSHLSAAALFGFVQWDDRHPEVTVTGPATRVHRGIRTHRTRRLDALDVARHEGIPVTSPARTLVDLAATLPYRSLRRATRQAQALGRVNVRQLAQTLDRLGPRRGVGKLRRILATGPAPTGVSSKISCWTSS